jgi:hypothetical protein
LLSVGSALAVALQASLAFSSPPVTAAGLQPWSYIGWEADGTTGRNVCLLASLDRCQQQRSSAALGGFEYPAGVATDPGSGDLYVAEVRGDRVQQLTEAGIPVRSFASGVRGSAAGQLAAPESVAVEPSTGDVYALTIAEGDLRIDKFSRDGHFLWRVGGDVDRATGADFCDAHERRQCGAGKPNTTESDEHDAFRFANQAGDLLAFDARRGLLYVGDEHRVQVFGPDGSWLREIPLVSISAKAQSSVVALALDPDGDLYAVYRARPPETLTPREQAGLIHEFAPDGRQVAIYRLTPRSPSSVMQILGLAIGSAGQVAAMGVEVGPVTAGRFALLGRAGGWTSMMRFEPPSDNDGISFGPRGKLYAATAVDQTVVAYSPASNRGVLGWTSSQCAGEAEVAFTDVTACLAEPRVAGEI